MSSLGVQVILFSFLAGCTSINGKTANGGEFHVYRFATDAAIQIGADGSVSYSSSPTDLMQEQLIQLLSQALQAKAPPAQVEVEPVF